MDGLEVQGSGVGIEEVFTHKRGCALSSLCVLRAEHDREGHLSPPDREEEERRTGKGGSPTLGCGGDTTPALTFAGPSAPTSWAGVLCWVRSGHGVEGAQNLA